ALDADRQAAGWVDLAKEDLGERGAPLLARVPGFQGRGDPVEPAGHLRPAAGGEDDDRSRVGGGALPDQLLPSRRQREGTVPALRLAAGVEADREDHQVRRRGQLQRRRVYPAVDALDAEPEVWAAETARVAVLQDHPVGGGVERHAGGIDRGDGEAPAV